MTTLKGFIFAALLLTCILGVTRSCPQTPEQLEKFLEVAARFQQRINAPTVAEYLAAYDYFDENGVMEVNYIGRFHNKILAQEYGLLLFLLDIVKIHSDGIYNNTVKFYADNVISYQYNYSISANSGTQLHFYNLMPTDYITFDPNSCDDPIITYALTIEDRFAQQIFESTATAEFGYDFVCNTIQATCVGADQQYASVADCLDTFHNLFPAGHEADVACPYYLSSNTGSCRQTHALIATFEPPVSTTLHCPHTGTDPNLTPCADSCLSGCGACTLVGASSPHAYPTRNVSTNAHCVPSVNGPTVTFSCQCDAGTINTPSLTDPGKIYCKPIQCTKDKDCRSSKGWAKCTSGACTPLSGFSWDSSPQAYQTKKTVYCEYGKDRVYNDQNGVPRCVPKGSCIYGVKHADKQCSSTANNHNEKKTAKCVKLDSQDSIPFNRFGGCFCTDLNGTKYPCGF